MSKTEPPDPDDHIEYYRSQKSKNSSENTMERYKTSLNKLRNFLEKNGIEAEDMQEPDAIEFLEYLEKESSPNAADQYSKDVKRFYEYYAKRGTFETNPIALALEDWEYEKEHRELKEIPFGDLQEICVNEIKPIPILLFTILPKTGMRVGELQSMDLTDIHLQHPIAQNYLPEPRYEIEQEPDTLYIPPTLGGDKRNFGTHVPIDGELKQALLYWIATYVTPPTSVETSPLVQIRKGSGMGVLGTRPSRATLRRWVAETAKKYGWWESGASYQENMTPHSFRHFFSTYAEHEEYGGKMDRDVIEYIRGDTGNVDTIDEYQHRWGKDTRKKYLNNIFKLYK